jgi:DNA-directed RNA polymerase specialized sigma24 family protein
MESTSPEATSPYPPEDLAELRRRMVMAALRRGVGWDDAEDVVQEALAKLLREQPRTGAPPLQIRAFAALRDKRVEFMRARARERERRVQGALAGPGADDEGRGVDIPEEDARLALVEACQLVCGIAGYDAMCFAALKALGATERDVAEFMGWPAHRVAAARVRLARKKATITRALLETLTPKEEESW